MNQVTKYLLEVIVIIISVLAAFWLENVRENQQRLNDQKDALRALSVEIQTNKAILDDNIRVLSEFNEFNSVLKGLFNQGQDSLIAPISFLDSIKRRHPSNGRIQKLGKSINGDRVIIYNSASIDFFLGRLNFGMWETTKFSGILIGMKLELVQSLFATYSAFETEFGFTEEDYHKAISEEVDDFLNLDAIIQATKNLENGFRLKEILLRHNYDHTMGLIKVEIGEVRSDSIAYL